MGKVIYSAEATVTGGRDVGHGRTSDGALEVNLRLPGAEGEPGTNPEQLFAVGYGSCFESSIKVVGRRMKAEIDDVIVDSVVSLVTNDRRGFDLAVELHVKLPSVTDAGAAQEIVKAAHEVCPYSNATRGNIDVTVTVNGEPLS